MIVLFVCCFIATAPADAQQADVAASSSPIIAPIFRTPLSEAGQSGVCLQGDRLFLTVHKKLSGELKEGFLYSSDIVGQCFDKRTGGLLWQVDLPGSYAGLVLESWNDATSLTPVADGRHVVFHNLNGMLGCFTHDGELVWKRQWQAPDPDIKNCRMFLHHDHVIVSLTSDTLAVPASKDHPDLPYYQLHAIELATGNDAWVSSVLLHHATQYSLDRWRDQTVIVASMIDLSHWKFGRKRQGFLIAAEGGRLLKEFSLPPAVPHKKNQLCQGQFLVTSANGGKSTLFQMVDPDSGEVTKEFRIAKPDRYFAWTGSKHELADFQPLFADDRLLGGKGQPTPSTVHAVGNRIYFWRYDTSAIGCIDVDTGQSTFIQAPLQVRADATAWLKSEFKFTDGIQNSSGMVVNQRVGTARGIERGGFGHTNPAWPTLHNDKLYWINGAGVLYIIDTTITFGPDAFRWVSADPTGSSWTYGCVAVDESSVYLRSQRELIGLDVPQADPQR